MSLPSHRRAVGQGVDLCSDDERPHGELLAYDFTNDLDFVTHVDRLHKIDRLRQVQSTTAGKMHAHQA